MHEAVLCHVRLDAGRHGGRRIVLGVGGEPAGDRLGRGPGVVARVGADRQVAGPGLVQIAHVAGDVRLGVRLRRRGGVDAPLLTRPPAFPLAVLIAWVAEVVLMVTAWSASRVAPLARKASR